MSFNRPNACNAGQGRRPGRDSPRRNLDLNPYQDLDDYNNFAPEAEEQEFYARPNNFIPEDEEFYPQPYQHGFGFGEDDAWMSETHLTDLPSLQDRRDYAQEINDNVVNGLNYEAVPFDFWGNHEVNPPQAMEIANQPQQPHPIVEQQEPQPLLESLLPAKDVLSLERLDVHLGDPPNMDEAIRLVSMVDAAGDPVREATWKVMEAVLEPVAAHNLTWDVVQAHQRDFRKYTNVISLIFAAVQSIKPGGTTGRELYDAIKQWLSAAQVRNVAG